MRASLHTFIYLVWIALSGLVALPARADGAIHLVLSETEQAYEEAARAFEESLGKGGTIRVWNLKELGQEQLSDLSHDENLIVSIGLKATRFIAEHHAGRGAVLGLMVPRTSADNLRWPGDLGPGKLAFVYIDQPVERSLSLLVTVLPHKRRIGVIVSVDNGEILKALEREAGRRGLVVNPAVVEDASDVGPSLRRVLANSDVLLLLPDVVVLGGTNLQSLLMASYRLRVPVLGFSPGLVKSGAVAAVFSTPSQLGAQAGLMARRWVTTGSLPASQHAGQFSIDINNHVARSLGLSLPPERAVAKAVGARD